MSFKEKINDWSYIIFLILCFLIFVLGFMILRLPESSCDINDLQIVNRLSNELRKPQLPTPSTPTLPTDPPPPENAVIIDENVDCGQEGGQYQGESTYPGRKDYNLGSSIGEVKILFQPLQMPDRFIVYYDDKRVIDTGYRGGFSTTDPDTGIETIYTWNTIGSIHRDEFIQGINNKEDPLTKLKYPNTSIPGTLNDGFPKVIDKNVDYYEMSFMKYSSSINKLSVFIYAPGLQTKWDIVVGCPGEVIYPPLQGI